MPLPPKFVTGVASWRDVIDLKNPIHRVNAIHAAYDDLGDGFDVVEAHAKFRKDNGAAFKELYESIRDLEAIEPRLPEAHPIRQLLLEFRAARDQCTIADSPVWNSLQSKRATAAAAIISKTIPLSWFFDHDKLIFSCYRNRQLLFGLARLSLIFLTRRS